jgi:NADPH:quinone reductase-like Zn-dependent oxidoreductase
MPTEAQAWFLYEGTPEDRRGELAELRRERFTLPDPGADEVLAEPLYGSWEGNYHHALLRDPVDICRKRGEPRVVLGNAGVVRVLKTGADVRGLSPGDVAMIHGAGRSDRFGHMTHALAYDAPGTMGCLATRMIIRQHNLVPVPANSRHTLAQWAAFTLRYVTAWSNWELAYGTFRLLVPEELLPAPHVWGWGGGTTLAELDLACRHGARCVMISGSDDRLARFTALGLDALDRRPFAALTEDPGAYPTADAWQAARKAAERRFLGEVEARTRGEQVQIFVDYIGTPVLEVTLRALGRCGVLTTAGWKHGMEVRLRRAQECILRHQHVHTHYASRPQHLAAVAYAEATGWMPELDEPIVGFDEIPALARRFADNRASMFPVFSVNPE